MGEIFLLPLSCQVCVRRKPRCPACMVAMRMLSIAISQTVHLQRVGLQLSYICKVSCLEIYQVSASSSTAMLREHVVHEMERDSTHYSESKTQ